MYKMSTYIECSPKVLIRLFHNNVITVFQTLKTPENSNLKKNHNDSTNFYYYKINKAIKLSIIPNSKTS